MTLRARYLCLVVLVAKGFLGAPTVAAGGHLTESPLSEIDQEAMDDEGRRSRPLEISDTDHSVGASPGDVQPLVDLLQSSVTSPFSHEDLITLSPSEDPDASSSISESVLSRQVMHVPSVTVPNRMSDYCSQYNSGKAYHRFSVFALLSPTATSRFPFASSMRYSQRDVLSALPYHAHSFLSPRNDRIARWRSWQNTPISHDSELTIRMTQHDHGTKSVASLTKPATDPFTPTAMTSPKVLVCGNTTILTAERSERQRRSVQTSSTVWSWTPDLPDDQATVTFQEASNTPATSVVGDLSTSEFATWPDPSQSSTSLADVTTSVLDNVTAFTCGRGGNWSCKGRCGHPPSLPCSCDALCHLTSHCCEDFYSECSLPSSAALAVFDGSQLHCRHGYMVVTSCPKTWVGSETGKACRSRKASAIDDLSPVSDTVTGVVFANVHCARCNGVTDVKEWEASVDCSFIEGNFADLQRECKFSFHVPANYSAQRCLYGAVIYRYYRSCPRTADPLLVEKCHKFHSYVTTAEYFPDFSYIRVWKNVYCLQCMWSSFPNAICLESLDVGLGLSKFHGGNFMMMMKWNVGGGAHVYVEKLQLEAPPLVYKMDCNANFQCVNKTCLNGSVLLRDYNECLPSLFNILVNLYFLNESTKDEFASTFSAGLMLGLELNQICPVNLRRITSDSEGITVHFQCVSSILNEMENDTFACLLTATVRKAHEFLQKDLKIVANTSHTQILWPSFHNIGPTDCYSAPNARHAVMDVPRVDGLFQTVERYVSLTGCSLSVLALSLRVALQFCMPYFRSVPSKLQLALASSLLLAYVGFLAGAEVPEGTWGCWAVAVLTHSAFVASFLWMNVFAFHLWRSLSKMQSVTMNRDARGILMRAAAYCSLCTVLLIGTAVAFDLTLPDHVVTPRYARPGCWLNNGWGLLTFFVVPSSLICAANAVFAILTLRLASQQRMHNWKDVASNPMVDVLLAVRLVILTGVTWLVGVVAGLANVSALWMVFTLLNSLLGFAIGLNLILNRRNIRFYRQKLFERSSQGGVTQSSNVA